MDAKAAPETVAVDENEDERIPHVLVSRTPTVVVFEPDTVRFDAARESNVPPLPRRSTGSQTSRHGCGRGHGRDS